jgi:ADP-ribosyl-[dinitrogen reductase] hydrolase
MLMGIHCGDALGTTNEFGPPSPEWNTQSEIVGGGKHQWAPGASTSDTDLTLCVLKALIDDETFSINTVKEEILKWSAQAQPDIGQQTLAAIELWKAGKSYEAIDNTTFPTNGSLMRSAPLALLQMPEPELEKVVRAQTMLTHPHEDCIAADWVFVQALRMALQGKNRNTIFNNSLNIAKSKSYRLYEILLGLPKMKWEEVNTDGHCFHTLSAAMWALLNYNSFEYSVIAVVNRGQDADTAGAVTGALCGAYYSLEEVPWRWLDKLTLKNQLLFEVESLITWKGPELRFPRNKKAKAEVDRED